MMRSYLEHWGLRSRPFETTFGERFFFAGSRHREALERLLYLVRDGNMSFGLLTGEIGCGKSMVASVLEERLRGRECRVISLENTCSDFDELLLEITLQARQTHARPGSRCRYRPADPHRDRYRMLTSLRSILEQKFARLRRRLVLVLDEAQQLSPQTLIELKNLTNFTSRRGNCLSIILVGQPELAELVRSLPQVDQRVGLRYHLLPLDAEEVGEYVDWRMRAAGFVSATGASAFTGEAKQMLHEASDGIAREINRICKLALDRAFSLRARQVDAEVVRSIAEDVLEQHAWSL